MVKYRLKEFMDYKNLNIQQVSDMTGLSRNTIRLMRENLSEGIQFKTLSILLSTFKCSVYDILYIEEEAIGLEEYKNNLMILIKNGSVERGLDE